MARASTRTRHEVIVLYKLDSSPAVCAMYSGWLETNIFAK